MSHIFLMTSVSHFWIIRYKINVRNPEAAMNLTVCFPRLTSVLLLNETVPCSSITIRLIWQCSVSRSTLFALRLESFYTWTTESKHNERCLEKQDEIFRLRRYDTVWFLSKCSYTLCPGHYDILSFCRYKKWLVSLPPEIVKYFTLFLAAKTALESTMCGVCVSVIIKVKIQF